MKSKSPRATRKRMTLWGGFLGIVAAAVLSLGIAGPAAAFGQHNVQYEFSQQGDTAGVGQWLVPSYYLAPTAVDGLGAASAGSAIPEEHVEVRVNGGEFNALGTAIAVTLPTQIENNPSVGCTWYAPYLESGGLDPTRYQMPMNCWYRYWQ